MKHILCSTMKNYKRISSQRYFLGDHHGSSVNLYLNGLCTDCRTACSIWTIRFGIPDSVLCTVLNIAAIHFESMRHRRQLSEQHWYHFGIESGSEAAMQYVPVIAFLTGIWLLLFYFLKAGRIVDFISTPVMEDLSAIALTIILMQIPKILGGKAGSGELPELLRHIAETCKEISWLSVVLGVGALLLLRMAGKVIPKFPAAIVIMAAGVAATMCFRVNEHGVVLLDAVEKGLPKLVHFHLRELT